MTTAITDSLVKYKNLPIWTEITLPESFQTQHNTKSGTWGKITVVAGQLQYEALNETGELLSTNIITPQHTDFFVSPEAWHRVKPLGPLRCFVEFYCRSEDYFQKKYHFAAPHRDVQALIQGPLANYQTMNVLDLGCGKGRNATYLYAQGHRVTALDKNASAIQHLQEIIQTEKAEDRFQARVYKIESAALDDQYDLIISTVVFQFLRYNTLSSVIENMQAQTKPQGYNFIIAPVSSSESPCPIHFPSTFAPQELRNYYNHWHICEYQEQRGTFHRKDSNGNPIEATFATLLAQKRVV
ncbi:tellurite resistance protein [Leptolyngbya sp. Heron Island J]|uniref:SAM-dependent methyltransferase TehB n=1 Tax=Leptolyngbya sp. Heron Island J TaxID=1385935 RepID=UPI0003B94839|nr:SAM-dependent methyltransferase TehB [Leptolyngbya sp. Heron Island J]ESA33350.1 tellurite resistance protein [Leptolyngbya sp. Heron Island J]